MSELTIAGSIHAVAAGAYTVGIFLKDEVGVTLAENSSPVVVPAAPAVPVVDPPGVTVSGTATASGIGSPVALGAPAAAVTVGGRMDPREAGA